LINDLRFYNVLLAVFLYELGEITYIPCNAIFGVDFVYDITVEIDISARLKSNSTFLKLVTRYYAYRQILSK